MSANVLPLTIYRTLKPNVALQPTKPILLAFANDLKVKPAGMVKLQCIPENADDRTLIESDSDDLGYAVAICASFENLGKISLRRHCFVLRSDKLCVPCGNKCPEKRETRNEKRETRNEKRETRNEKREISLEYVCRAVSVHDSLQTAVMFTLLNFTLFG